MELFLFTFHSSTPSRASARSLYIWVTKSPWVVGEGSTRLSIAVGAEPLDIVSQIWWAVAQTSDALALNAWLMDKQLNQREIFWGYLHLVRSWWMLLYQGGLGWSTLSKWGIFQYSVLLLGMEMKKDTFDNRLTACELVLCYLDIFFALYNFLLMSEILWIIF